jgi:hypothetical protein
MRYIILSSLALIILSCSSSFGTNYDDKISELEDLVSNLESKVYDNGSRISYKLNYLSENVYFY